jgi:hypothetical protein
LLWTPLAALAFAGLVVLAVRGQADARRVAWCALLMVAVQIYVSGSVESWTVAGAFGQRRFVALTILLTIGLAGLIAAAARRGSQRSARSWRSACGGTSLIAAFRTELMNRLELRQNAHDAFVTLPLGLPDLAHRYATGLLPSEGALTSHPLLRHPVSARSRQRRADDGDLPRAGAPGPRGASHRSARYARAGTRSVLMLLPRAATDDRHAPVVGPQLARRI